MPKKNPAERPRDQIGERVVRFRSLVGMSQSQVVAATGKDGDGKPNVSLSTLSKIERGERRDLTVTEAMWKGKAVVASKVGGIQDQIVDNLDGLLIEDPGDLEACASALGRLLDEPELAPRLGRSARARVLADFVGDRHLERYVELFSRLVGATDAALTDHEIQ